MLFIALLWSLSVDAKIFDGVDCIIFIALHGFLVVIK